MKYSKKQMREVEFLIKYFNAAPTQKQIEEYIEWTVFGNKPKYEDSSRSGNSLFIAKRKLDINIKMWTRDMKDGLLAYWELEEDFGCDYFNKLLRKIRSKLVAHPGYDGQLDIAVLGYLNSKYNLTKSDTPKP